MVYTSASLALASVEYFVHLDPSDAPNDLVSVSAMVPGEHTSIERIEPDTLPVEWRALENRVLQQLGKAWIVSQRSLTLQVPSVAVEGEWNVLLNPAHGDFQKINVEEAKAFRFDQRMFKASSI